MEQTLLKQHKELEELKKEIGNVCQSKNEIWKQSKQKSKDGQKHVKANGY
jgi:hypothetical protein